jgi:hypothetical protein
MLKVIQHGVRIAKFLYHQPSRLGRDRKIVTMGECRFHDVKKEVAIFCCWSVESRLSFSAISGAKNKRFPPEQKKGGGGSLGWTP